jgi:hypothetical protein
MARLVTQNAYGYNQLIDRLEQQDKERKRMDAVLMRQDTAIDTNLRASEVKVKNVHNVQQVEE